MVPKHTHAHTSCPAQIVSMSYSDEFVWIFFRLFAGSKRPSCMGQEREASERNILEATTSTNGKLTNSPLTAEPYFKIEWF